MALHPSPVEIWSGVLGCGLAVNFVAWRTGEKATLCSSTLRPAIEALGPIGEPAMWAGLFFFGRHLVKHTKRKARA